MDNCLTPIALVIPYFGTLPDYFPVWKMSALFNKTVDFLFFTDIDELQSDGNIKVYHISFEEFRALVQRKFPFEISLKKPYKLCDYKPVYGYALEEYLKGYVFWGHCDIDLIFGDIRKFMTEEILNTHDKILEHGHFTLYRNTPVINEHFMRCAGYGDYDYKKVFTSDDSLYFDECLGMRLISRKLGVVTYLNESCFFDVIPSRKEFTHISGEREETIFEYHNGSLFALVKRAGDTLEREIMYAHFQKRNMNYRKICCRSNKMLQTFYIIPNEAIISSVLMKRTGGGCFYRLARKVEHVKIYFKRYREGAYRSFREYRLQRASLRKNMQTAKNLIENWEGFAEGE